MSSGKPIFKEINLSYRREEKYGYLTLVPKAHPESGGFVINETGRKVLEFCDGHREITQIVAALEALYPGAPKDKLQTDIENILDIYSRLGVIEWIGTNPFLNRTEKIEGEDYSIRGANEKDISQIEKFLYANIGSPESEKYFSYMNPIAAKTEYSKLFLRRKLFSYNEEFFLLEAKEKIEGLIAISIPAHYKESGAIIKLLYCSSKYMKKLLGYAKDAYPKIAIQDITKIMFYESNLQPLNEEFQRILKKEGFFKEATLKNELGFEEDLTILSYLYTSDFIAKAKKQTKEELEGKIFKVDNYLI